MTTATSGSFLAKKKGTYYVWIDVDDGKGNTATAERVAVTVSEKPLPWTLNGVDAPNSVYVGETVTYSADISGDKTGLKYSYAWSWEGQWGDNWSSTKLENDGQMTTETTGTFTPTKEGTYHLWIDVEDAEGNSLTTSKYYVNATAFFKGHWLLYSMIEDGEVIDHESVQLAADGGYTVTLDLYGDMTMKLTAGDDSSYGTWESHGTSSFTLIVDGEPIDGVLEDNGMITISEEATGLTFERG
ncbi:MAG: hypothetical protein IJH83_01965 [Coriobacteriales bacterium]|nr:hypothetical protein [Coriobacteriales bacterium]